ncbi:MAG: hypothetical protein IEMM0008_0512 [bacterium]|nr:MAG: hypothetical protein IEMM0008_0512 [bacterium]
MARFTRQEADKDIDDFIAVLEDLDLNDKDRVEDVLESIRPRILEYYGKMVMKRVETLLRGNDKDRVIKIFERKELMRFPYAKVRLLFLVATLALFFGGMGLSIHEYYEMTYGKESVSWPFIDGVITSSKVTKHTSSSGGGSSRIGGGGSIRHRTITYKADIHYKYTINGKEYTNDKKAFGSSNGSSKEAHAIAIVKRYPKGKNVKVYYKPDDPGTAVLEPGFEWKTYLFILIGIMMFVVSLGASYYLFVRGKFVDVLLRD